MLTSTVYVYISVFFMTHTSQVKFNNSRSANLTITTVPLYYIPQSSGQEMFQKCDFTMNVMGGRQL